MALQAGCAQSHRSAGRHHGDDRAHLHPSLTLERSTELHLLFSPRRAYARLTPGSAWYIAGYVVFTSVLIAAAAGIASAGRVTVSMLLSLALGWMFVPLTQALIGAALVASARAPRDGGNGALALLLRGHAPWSLFLLAASGAIAGAAAFDRGYDAYRIMTFVAIVPVLLTLRIVHAFSIEVLRTSARGAVVRALAHQAATWIVAAAYLDRAVSLVPRIQGWLS